MVRHLIIFLIKAYQRVISPIIPARCRFHPTCSNYALDSIRTSGILRGSLCSIKRLIKCNPLHPGGYDPVIKEK